MVSVELSVILCTHNGSATIGAQVDALTRQQTSVPWELVLVDNRCTDDTVAVARSHVARGTSFRVVAAGERLGLGYARNVGAAAAQARYLAFCDDDDVVGAGWVDAITEAVRTHRFVASRMEYERLNRPEVIRGRFRFQDQQLSTLFGFAIANGAGFAIERELWELVGGNDEALTDTGEDTDFSIRVQRDGGVSPVLADRAIYHYRQRVGSWASFRQGCAYGRAHVTLYLRHGRAVADRSSERRRARRDWRWILTRLPFAIVPARRTAWARRAGLRVGRLQGSLKSGVWYP